MSRGAHVWGVGGVVGAVALQSVQTISFCDHCPVRARLLFDPAASLLTPCRTALILLRWFMTFHSPALCSRPPATPAPVRVPCWPFLLLWRSRAGLAQFRSLQLQPGASKTRSPHPAMLLRSLLWLVVQLAGVWAVARALFWVGAAIIRRVCRCTVGWRAARRPAVAGTPTGQDFARELPTMTGVSSKTPPFMGGRGTPGRAHGGGREADCSACLVVMGGDWRRDVGEVWPGVVCPCEAWPCPTEQTFGHGKGCCVIFRFGEACGMLHTHSAHARTHFP